MSYMLNKLYQIVLLNATNNWVQELLGLELRFKTYEGFKIKNWIENK
jgi:hypothetical protein